jgi:hypothetical protein
MVSTCGSGQVCASNACCTLPVCRSGGIGDPCGNVPGCGTTTSCGACSTAGGLTRNVCALPDGGASNTCTCSPYTQNDCAVLGTGTKPDGCGGFIICTG